ncbi:MAG: helix-turn-helix domain-containing protein [Gammaproteobacteria bacterium]|nr:helix-turn-helix domain-containing protein [Gammaproteobacteria bacterium]
MKYRTATHDVSRSKVEKITQQRLMEAVRELRQALRLTQTQFGGLLGRTLSTVQRYEGSVPPRSPQSLAEFALLARQHGRPDIAEVFAARLIEDLGASVVEVIAQAVMPASGAVPAPAKEDFDIRFNGTEIDGGEITPEERREVERLLRIVRSAKPGLPEAIHHNMVQFEDADRLWRAAEGAADATAAPAGEPGGVGEADRLLAAARTGRDRAAATLGTHQGSEGKSGTRKTRST